VGGVEAFDSQAYEYDRWFDTEKGKVLFEDEVEAVKLLMSGLEKPFLEVGVGTGRFAQALGIKFGVDPSMAMLELAAQKGVAVKQGKAESLPCGDNHFGGVFLLFTLCFLDDPEMALNEARRVLRPGGSLLICFINRSSSWGKLYEKKGAEGHPVYKYARFYDAGQVEELLGKAGLKPEAYSSTLSQEPSVSPCREAARNALEPDAGFVCIRARKER
jgi:ubiquinone/menaquinone biosynthesis C-methylase UbiE